MCRCERVTYLCLCSHKERHVERCTVYQLRKEGSCWACCFSKCHPRTRRYTLNRVCKNCNQYFYSKYGKHHYKKFIEYFLEYKQRKGWENTAIDPRTVPRHVLLQRQSAPACIPGTGQRTRGQPFQVHQQMVPVPPSSSRQANDDEEVDNDYASYDENTFTTPPAINNSPARLANKELSTTQQQIAQVHEQSARINPQPAHKDLRTLRGNPRPTPARQRPAPVNRQGTPFPHNSIHGNVNLVLPPEPKKPAPLYPNKDKPLPADPSFFVIGSDSDEDQENDSDDGDAGEAGVFPPSPPPKYNSSHIPVGNIVPELAHLAQGLPPQVIGQLQQPTPRTIKNNKAVIRNVDSISDTSVVKNLTKVARNLQIPNLDFIEYDGKLVPRVMTPPKGKRKTRTPTPSPPPTARPSSHSANPGLHSDDGMTAIDIAIAANTVPESLIPGGRRDKGEQSLSTFFVQTHPNLNSPSGFSAHLHRSKESVTMPPPKRLDGVLMAPFSAPQQGGKSATRLFFKERGLPSTTYIQECSSATLAPEVLVHSPKRRYSAAVQSCFCDDKMRASKDSERKCLSCRERDAIATDMKMTWI
ncbi:hypothetical protein F4803DRAFT_527872 [Xylaria telfairii]|nr:hypothetical protein F4803DRAFT_527872 [Xylaria telfairii]